MVRFHRTSLWTEQQTTCLCAPRRAGQAPRRVRGHQGRHQVHLVLVSDARAALPNTLGTRVVYTHGYLCPFDTNRLARCRALGFDSRQPVSCSRRAFLLAHLCAPCLASFHIPIALCLLLFPPATSHSMLLSLPLFSFLLLKLSSSHISHLLCPCLLRGPNTQLRAHAFLGCKIFDNWSEVEYVCTH